MKRIALIGAGHLAKSLVKGLSKQTPAASLMVSDIAQAKCEALKKEFPAIQVYKENAEMISLCDTVVLCVKPDRVKTVCIDIQKPLAQNNTLLISVAAGITLPTLHDWLQLEQQPILRCMPNLAVAVGAGMSVLCANIHLSHEHRSFGESIFGAVGKTAWLDNENLMDCVTALSGSGPAYFFRVIQAMEQAAQQLGMDPELARLLSEQTAVGAAQFAQSDSATPAVLCQKVASKGGTTESALAVLEQAGIDQIFFAAIAAATERSREIAKQMNPKGTK